MIDLTEMAGLPISFDPEALHISFGEAMQAPLYGTRSAADMRKVLADREAPLPDPVYWMFRDTGLRDVMQPPNLRYDLSYFRSACFGREPMKTSGHYHPYLPESDLSYPEVYELLYGNAMYLLQKVDNPYLGPEEVTVEDAIVLYAQAGDKIIMPPGYGHVTINGGAAPFVMTNWVSRKFASIYSGVEKCRGFAYRCIRNTDERHYWTRNEAYQKPLPPLRFAEVREAPELGLRRDLPLYTSCLQSSEKFHWLSAPAAYMAEIWSGLEITGEVIVE